MNSAAILFFVLMAWIVLVVLREVRPLWFYILAAVLFVLSQLDYFLLNKVRNGGTTAPARSPLDALPGDLQWVKG